MRVIKALSYSSKGKRTNQCALYLLTIFFIICFMSADGISETIKANYSFDYPKIEKVQIDGLLYDRIVMSDAPNSGVVGHPALPGYGAYILIPYGSDIEDIEIITGEKTYIGDGYSVEPMDRTYILSSSSDLPPVYRDEAIYSLTKAIPEKKAETIDVQYLHGYKILVLKIRPVEYIPASGALSLFREISVNITTKSSTESFPPLRNITLDRSEVAGLIDNPSDISTYDLATKTGSRSYDMLIITSSSLVDAFTPLKDYHDSTGVLTEIHTLTQIGSGDSHSIREYIKQEYLNNGIQYVLLGGDDDLIPSLKCYVLSWLASVPGAVEELSMPSEFYFSCLDGTFNYDNDSRWGEPTDGEGGGDVDFFPEVHVGRVAADSPGEVTNYVNKAISYMSGQNLHMDKILLAGEQLRFGGLGEYGGYAMDEMDGYSDSHGFLTYGFSDDVYNIDKLYDVLIHPNNYWPGSAIISLINSGYHIVDHLGHSGPGYAMRTDTSMLRYQLSNTDYCFIYAEGCSAGQFDLTDCWGEYVTTKLSTGGFGCIANSRLGLGSRSTAHPVHVFDREFWDAIYSADEAKPQIGRAISDARADHGYHIDDPGIRWTLYELTLFGDPAISIKPVSSLAISFPDGFPDMIPPYTDVPINVNVMGIGEGVPVSESGLLHYSVDGGEMESMPILEVAAGACEAALPPLPCGASIEFCVSFEESGGERIYAPALDSLIKISPYSDSLVIFQDDFESDLGWTISGGLWQRGIPTGQGGMEIQYPVPDPTEGCVGPNVFGYNLYGDYENDLPAVHITSPIIDCSGRNNVHLKFCRWLGVEQPLYDTARIMVSNDGVNWTQVWINYATIGDLEWEHLEYDISEIADDQQNVFVRWIMGPTDGGLRLAGWNIDDVRIVSYECVAHICGDANSDETVNVSDAVHIINYVFVGGNPPDPMEAGDTNCDSTCNVSDALWIINYVFVGGHDPCDTDGDFVPDC
jgi:Peptidase family C25/Propeptide_C25/Dockerin type I domain